MNQQIEKVIKGIPLYTLVIYIIGFVVYQSYFRSYGFNDFSILNFQYLSACYTVRDWYILLKKKSDDI